MFWMQLPSPISCPVRASRSFDCTRSSKLLKIRETEITLLGIGSWNTAWTSPRMVWGRVVRTSFADPECDLLCVTEGYGDILPRAGPVGAIGVIPSGRVGEKLSCGARDREPMTSTSNPVDRWAGGLRRARPIRTRAHVKNPSVRRTDPRPLSSIVCPCSRDFSVTESFFPSYCST